MPELPSISGQEAVKVFNRLGFNAVRQRGSHVVLRKDSCGCVIFRDGGWAGIDHQPIHRAEHGGRAAGCFAVKELLRGGDQGRADDDSAWFKRGLHVGLHHEEPLWNPGQADPADHQRQEEPLFRPADDRLVAEAGGGRTAIDSAGRNFVRRRCFGNPCCDQSDVAGRSLTVPALQ